VTGPTQWDLLEKTELRIERVGLSGANLTAVAAAVAGVLGLSTSEVVVIDARDDLLALDLLRPSIDPYQLVGRRTALLDALGAVPGVSVNADTDLCAQGMLGWIGDDAELGIAALDRAQTMAAEIDRVIAMRAIVFSTGPEVASGQIEDTNKPWILSRLAEAEYSVTPGENLPDDTTLIAAALREAAEERGFGLIVTTGGVGAEGKDGTVEALLCVDPDAATPHLFLVEQGVGRHTKPGVRIGVGSLAGALIVCLPGPHLEATEGTRALVTALATTREPVDIASAIAATLRRHLHAGASAWRHP